MPILGYIDGHAIALPILHFNTFRLNLMTLPLTPIFQRGGLNANQKSPRYKTATVTVRSIDSC